MSKKERIKVKIRNSPQDVRWAELVRFLESEGFRLRKRGKGSGRVFKRADGVQITLHQPHGNRKVDPGAIDLIARLLKIK